MKPAFPDIVRAFLPILLLIASASAFAQTVTMTTTGNWNVATNWASSDIGDQLTETVNINNSVSPTIPTGLSYTVGATTLLQDNNLTLDVSSTLNVGASGTPADFTTNLNANITVVSGATLEIWGDFVANNNVILNLTGNIIIHGSMKFSGSGTSVTVNGTGKLYVYGNLGQDLPTAGPGNVNFTDNGYVEVYGYVNLGGGSNLTGSGVFYTHGGCMGPASFCGSGILPVDLLYFRSRNTPTNVELVWSTASEVNVDFFLLERSLDGKEFFEITRVLGAGDSHTENVYSVIDEKPSAGISFYRLSEVSREGVVKTISVIRNAYDASKEVYLSPNPLARDQSLQLSLNFKASQPHDVSVFDLRGVLVSKSTMNGSEASLPLSLSAGVYVVKVASGEFVSVQRIVVQ